MIDFRWKIIWIGCKYVLKTCKNYGADRQKYIIVIIFIKVKYRHLMSNRCKFNYFIWKFIINWLIFLTNIANNCVKFTQNVNKIATYKKCNKYWRVYVCQNDKIIKVLYSKKNKNKVLGLTGWLEKELVFSDGWKSYFLCIPNQIFI